MTTLYIRDVPDFVAETLKARAAAQGQSLSAYVGGQLASLAARPDNATIVARLRERERASGVTVERIVAEVKESRR